MNACDTNKTLPNKRNAFIDNPKTIKRLAWVQDIDKRVKARVEERVKVIKIEKHIHKSDKDDSHSHSHHHGGLHGHGGHASPQK